MRHCVLLLALAAALSLSGCTVIVPVMASGSDRSAARRAPAVSPATLRPGEPVRLLLRSGAEVDGRWAGVDATTLPQRYLLSVPNSMRMSVSSDLVAHIARAPRPGSLVGPVLVGLLVDGFIVWRIREETRCLLGGCDDGLRY